MCAQHPPQRLRRPVLQRVPQPYARGRRGKPAAQQKLPLRNGLPLESQHRRLCRKHPVFRFADPPDREWQGLFQHAAQQGLPGLPRPQHPAHQGQALPGGFRGLRAHDAGAGFDPHRRTPRTPRNDPPATRPGQAQAGRNAGPDP